MERRQQIGVLRAIGYRRGMVQLSFLLESSFVVLLGVAIGVGLGTVISYLIVREIREDVETIRFAVPVDPDCGHCRSRIRVLPGSRPSCRPSRPAGHLPSGGPAIRVKGCGRDFNFEPLATAYPVRGRVGAIWPLMDLCRRLTWLTTPSISTTMNQGRSWSFPTTTGSSSRPGAMDEFTTRRNRSAFEDLKLRPRFMRDVSERNLSTTVLGQEISMPVMVAPAGSHMLAHPDGEVATARGTGMSNTLMMLSTSSNYSMEEVSDAASGPLWFQLYHRGWALHRDAGAPGRGGRVQGHRADGRTRPCPAPRSGTCATATSARTTLGNFRGMDADRSAISGTDETPGWDVSTSPSITWRELERLRGSDLPAAGAEGSADRRGRSRWPLRTESRESWFPLMADGNWT